MYEIQNGHKMPKQRRKPGAMPQAVKKAIDDYKAAYKALYGVGAPNVEWRDAFNDEQRDRMQSAADLLNVRDGGLGGLGALLAAILGRRVNVETVVVVPNEGESIDEAIKRTLADNEASTKAFTKH